MNEPREVGEAGPGPEPRPATPSRSRLAELAAVFLKLGVIGFGGPAAHLALLEDEVVGRRRWIDRQQFLDLVGVTHLIPGPNSTEMAIHLGLLRGGFAGMLVAGVCFIVPAAAITGAFAWAYVAWGSLPQVEPVLLGIQPAVLAVIFAAVLRLGRAAASTLSRASIGAAVAIAVLLGAGEVPSLLAGGIAGMLILVLLRKRAQGPDRRSPRGAGGAAVLAVTATLLGAARRTAAAAGALAATAAAGLGSAANGVPLLKLGLFFLEVGAVLYGGGYVLVALLEGGLVRDHGWLAERQLLDAVAVGQLTPGPILSTATFVGYLLAGVPGAAVATVAIFLPSFVFVVFLRILLPWLRRGTWKRAFLDAVNASAVGLMGVALWKLSSATFFPADAAQASGAGLRAVRIAIALAGAAALIRWRVHPAWVILGGGIVGGMAAAVAG